VPDPRDKSDSSPSPDPELNPLVNPLLAAHMGRWAEVYFTNPPEKRDQAVSDLLRELEHASPPESVPVHSFPDPSAGKKTSTADSPNLSPPPLEPDRPCAACAYYNSPEQKFCGMCGALLLVSPETRTTKVAEEAPIAGMSRGERSRGGNPAEDAIGPGVDSVALGERTEAPELGSLLPKKSPPNPSARSESLPYGYRFYRYRLYIAAGLAILLTVVGYMAGRRPQARLDTAAAPSASAIPHSQPQPANSERPPSAARSTLPASAALPTGAQNKNQVDASSPRDQTADSQLARRTAPVSANSSAVDQSGALELATAQNYLTGSAGTRNSAVAVQWLWKAVGKRNLEATLTLSDLYLRGDGVPKSCDQARLLLDAAARKGAKAAAERLRNLQASGCQ
jgi:hypothetical protein